MVTFKRSCSSVPISINSVHTTLVAAFVAVITAASPALAIGEDEVVGARAAAMGGAYRALAFDNSAIDLNPAGMGQFKRFSFEMGYELDANVDGRAFQASLVDSMSGPLASGFAFYDERADAPGSATGRTHTQRMLLGFGIPLSSENFYAGVTGRYVRIGVPDDATITGLTAYTVDVGFLARPLQSFSVGVVFNNLVDANRAELPLNGTAGVAFMPTSFLMIAADAVADMGSTEETEYGYSGGIQVGVSKAIWLRSGYRVHAVTQQKDYTAGAGYLGERWSLDYAALRVAEGDGEMRHAVSANFLVF